MKTRLHSSCLSAIVLLAGVTIAPAQNLATGAPFDVTPQLEKADQRWPAVAAGKDSYLVVWQDGEAMDGVPDTGIYAARVSAEGKSLDPKPIAVCEAKGFQTYPSVAFDGANFIVAWQDYRGAQDWDLYAARLSSDGKVLDADGFAVAAVPGNQIYPSVASDGKGATLIVWSDIRSGYQPEVYRLCGTFVTDGKPAEAGGKEIAKAASSLLRPYVAWDGEAYGVIAGHATVGWTPAQPFAVRVAPDGKTATWKVPLFLGQTYCLSADPAGKKALLWSNARHEHGSYCCIYLASVVQDVKTGSGTRNLVAGLQEKYPPRNDLFCASAFDGKSFVAVVEQSPGYGSANRSTHDPINVELTAFRVNPADGASPDVGTAPAGDSNDLRRAVKTKEYKDAVAKKVSGVKAAAEPKIQLRHPAMASTGGGKSLLVYSRRGGIGQFKIRGVVLSQ